MGQAIEREVVLPATDERPDAPEGGAEGVVDVLVLDASARGHEKQIVPRSVTPGVRLYADLAEALRALGDAPRPRLIVVGSRVRGMPRSHALQVLRQRVADVPVVAMQYRGAARWQDAWFEPRTGRTLGHYLSADQPDAPAASTPIVDDTSLALASEAMRDIYHQADLIAETGAPVILEGETGVGKEVLAHYIHQRSSRRAGPFVKVNCAAVPADLLESELFGYERGAFTGAVRLHPGRFEMANGGTLFLDEITEFAPHLQVKLLHAIEDGRFARVGGESPITCDARVIAATNRPLREALAEGTFREDLYYRLNVFHLSVPPLRGRPDDVAVLCDYFVERYARLYNKRPPVLSSRIRQFFEQYPWPGNVRQLANALARLTILGDEAMLMKELEALTEDRAGGPADASVTSEIAPLKVIAKRAAQAAETDLLKQVLSYTHWNRVRAAQLLGISYKTLLTKITACGLTPPKGRRTR